MDHGQLGLQHHHSDVSMNRGLYDVRQRDDSQVAKNAHNERFQSCTQQIHEMLDQADRFIVPEEQG